MLSFIHPDDHQLSGPERVRNTRKWAAPGGVRNASGSCKQLPSKGWSGDATERGTEAMLRRWHLRGAAWSAWRRPKSLWELQATPLQGLVRRYDGARYGRNAAPLAPGGALLGAPGGVRNASGSCKQLPSKGWSGDATERGTEAMLHRSDLEGRCLQRLEASETPLGVASNSPPRVGQATRRSAVRKQCCTAGTWRGAAWSAWRRPKRLWELQATPLQGLVRRRDGARYGSNAAPLGPGGALLGAPVGVRNEARK